MGQTEKYKARLWACSANHTAALGIASSSGRELWQSTPGIFCSALGTGTPVTWEVSCFSSLMGYSSLLLSSFHLSPSCALGTGWIKEASSLKPVDDLGLAAYMPSHLRAGGGRTLAFVKAPEAQKPQAGRQAELIIGLSPLALSPWPPRHEISRNREGRCPSMAALGAERLLPCVWERLNQVENFWLEGAVACSAF